MWGLEVGQLQDIGKNYYRVKHYVGPVNGKLSFEYHKQSLQYIKGFLDTLKDEKNITKIGLI